MSNNTPRPTFKEILPFMGFMLKSAVTDSIKPIKKPEPSDVTIKNDEIRIWAIGHATTLINFYGTTILTDPVFANWIPFPRRLVAPGISIDQLPNIDYIIISHGHLDHFNRKSLKQLASKTKTLVIPKNSIDIVKGMDFKKVIETEWSTPYNFDDMEIFAFQPRHWGQRFPWERVVRGFNSYILKKNDKCMFFCGDSGYGDIFKTLGGKLKIDIALLPIGAYLPRDFMKPHHMNPEEALQAFIDLRAEHFIPIHWGNFRLSLEPIDEPPQLLNKLAAQKGIADKIHILKNGQSFTL
jgi:L-ascorbate metabolism protein UlaG (beta-lactamase superfamily)